jgi:hypothetical protein
MRKLVLFLRGAVPLAFVALVVVGVPALLAWWVLGGPFGWRHIAIGLIVGVGLGGGGGLVLGWALGKRLKGE